jgi:ribosome assembly protein YihI (activator of Der GTPase)
MMNVAFPRGRRPREEHADAEGSKRKRDNPVDNDFLFGEKKSAVGHAKKKKQKQSEDPPVSSSLGLPLGGGNVVHSKKDATIEALSFKGLAKGTKLLGMVREVNADFCLISLPSLLTGYVLPKNDVS